jgi:iron complex outermembrane receptor protein
MKSDRLLVASFVCAIASIASPEFFKLHLSSASAEPLNNPSNQIDSLANGKVQSVEELQQISTNASGLLAQNSTSPVQITGVKLNPTANGIEVTLETASGSIVPPAAQTSGKLLYFDIPNAKLMLPQSDRFVAENPAEGVANVSVSQANDSYVRVIVTGVNALPQASLVSQNVDAKLNPVAQADDDEEEEVTVTGDLAPSYRVPNASVTGTDTPILETPFSVQVIPQQIIRDQQVTQVKDAVGNVSSVTYAGNSSGRSGNQFNIRGFSSAPVLLDGFRRAGSAAEADTQPNFEVANLEQIEVLKGPASILYGAIEPGGVINLVTKQPLATPFYELELQAGSRGFVRPRFDLSGPLSDDGKVLYRLNGLFQTLNSASNFTTPDRKYFIAPTIAWKISDQTDLKIALDYSHINRPADFGLPAIGKSVANVPRDRIIGEPSDTVTGQTLNVGYALEHRFDPIWKLRNAFRYTSTQYDFGVILLPLAFNEAASTLFRVFGTQESQKRNYTFQTNVTGEFATGDVKHTLLAGVDYVYQNSRLFSAINFNPQPLNLFNPTYGLVKPSKDSLLGFGGNTTTSNSFGFYLQDQVSIFENLKILAGFRYDAFSQKTINIPGSSTLAGESTIDTNAFTPRLGLLYKLTDAISLYGSYSQSFTPNSGTTAAGKPLDPQRGSGYEFGIKADLLANKLFATLAYFDITKTNVPVTDPNFPLFSIATGEQRSRGLEFDISGELSTGWNIIASYAYINGEVTADTNAANVGKKLFGSPEHSASLWTTYEIQSGDLQGLGFGLGLKYVGDRQGDLANSFSLGSYFTTDAAIFYKRDKWRFALNFKNIGDVKYIESTTGSRSSGNTLGDPFTVVGSVSLQF